jgi:hypothetical protein
MWCFLRAPSRKKNHMYTHTPGIPNEPAFGLEFFREDGIWYSGQRDGRAAEAGAAACSGTGVLDGWEFRSGDGGFLELIKVLYQGIRGMIKVDLMMPYSLNKAKKNNQGVRS